MGLFKNSLKREIEFRYNVVKYKKMVKNYTLNRAEKNNIDIIKKAIEELTVEKENESLLRYLNKGKVRQCKVR